MKEFIDKTSERAGTPLNRANMMAVQGFESKTTIFNSDGSITERNANGEEKTIIFKDDGSILERFVGEKTITKTIIFGVSDEGIMEMVEEL